ncbi:MAG: hypothetical protein JXA18_03290 [Chitinispirillaceae bacterium]|nr:hypothetical protein [Chitinispirillaceae bacterium]
MKKFRIIPLPVAGTAIVLNFFPGFAQTLQSALAEKIDIVVAADGSGDYTKVQDAIAAIPDSNPARKVIFLKKGTYREKLIVPWKKTHITLVGEHVDSSIITYNDASLETIAMNTFTSHSMRVDADFFEAVNLTISNTSTSAQAVALHANGDCQVFLHCRIKGWQDTYFNNIRTRNYFKDCVMEGAVDYLFGFGIVLFDSCLINTIRTDGYMSAAATSQNYKFGFVFMNCKISNPSTVTSFYLGRPWFAYARTVLLNCWESSAVNKAGWKAWNGREETCFYREYKCTGPGSSTSGRVDFGKQLTDQEAKSYTLDSIFSASAFPLGEAADTFETNTILRRFEVSTTPNMVDIARFFLKCGRDTFPPLPELDWRPRVDTNSIYAIVRSHTARLLDSGKVAVSPKGIELYSRVKKVAVFHNQATNRLTARFDPCCGSGKIVMALYDAGGRFVVRRRNRAVQGQTAVSWRIPVLDQGIYYYRADLNGAVFYGKIGILPRSHLR